MRDMGFYVLSIVILLFTFYDGVIHRREAALYLLAYALYIVVLSYRPSFVRSPKPTQIVDIPEEVEKIEQEAERRIPII
jgi:Ca2+/Na+ antiporter